MVYKVELDQVVWELIEVLILSPLSIATSCRAERCQGLCLVAQHQRVRSYRPVCEAPGELAQGNALSLAHSERALVVAQPGVWHVSVTLVLFLTLVEYVGSPPNDPQVVL